MRQPAERQPRLDPDILRAAIRIQALREEGQLRHVHRLVLHLKPEGVVGCLEVGTTRTYGLAAGGEDLRPAPA